MARRRRQTVTLEGYDVPPELLDREAECWHSMAGYVAFLERNGLPVELLPCDRLRGPEGGHTHPANRRNHASAIWGRANRITTTWGGTSRPDSDLNRLTQMGLYG